MTKSHSESGITFNIPITVNSNEKIPRRSDPVFYNPKQALNRDISVAVLKAWSFLNQKIFSNLAEPFSGSGIRVLRYAVQAGSCIESIYTNDIASKSIEIIKQNLSKNKELIKAKNIHHFNLEGKIFFLEMRKKDIFFDFIDIDPYGTPQPFMRSALLTIEKQGVIAVTATDMPVITGLYPDKAYRLYGIPFKLSNRSYCHEIGLRMFIAYLQREGLFYKQKLVPILSYYADHYVRVFLVNSKDYSIDDIIHSHGYILDCVTCNKRTLFNWKKKDKHVFVCENCQDPSFPIGPIFLGSLHDPKLIDYLHSHMEDVIENGMIDRKQRYRKMITAFKEDLKVDIPWFYALGDLGKIMKKSLPSPKEMVEILTNMGYTASLTHFSGQGIKTNYALELDEGSKFISPDN